MYVYYLTVTHTLTHHHITSLQTLNDCLSTNEYMHNFFRMDAQTLYTAIHLCITSESLKGMYKIESTSAKFSGV